MAKKVELFDYVKFTSGKLDGTVTTGYGKVVAFTHDENPIVQTPNGKVTVILGGLMRDRYPHDTIRKVSPAYLKAHKIEL